MPTSYAKNKQHIYAWRQKNLEKKREIDRKSMNRYRNWKKISAIFLNILID